MTPPPVIKDLKKQTPRWVWVVLGLSVAIALFPIAVPVIIFGGDAIKERRSRIRFDAETWRNTGKPYGVIGVRLQMVDDLMKSHILDGQSRYEVVQLLGEPDGDPSVKPRFPKWQMHYYLGPSRGTVLFRGFDYDYLVLRLDAQGKVAAVGIVTLKT
jgi:hypothetical protein